MRWHLGHLFKATRGHVGHAARTFAAREFLPAELCDDDLFLVEFPKSGITWLTFLMANVNALLNGDRRSVTFFNINDFVPDVQSVRHVSLRPSGLPGYRCFKSHSPHIHQYRKVFYLVRDPRHVMVSYWAFLQGLGWWHGSLDQLVAHKRFGVRAWADHVAGWLDDIDPAASFTLIRYEDLLSNPADELQRLYRLLGLPVTAEILAAAVERSNIESMRRLEAQFNAGHPAVRKLQFVRPARAGGPREPLPGSTRELIERIAGPIMRRLGYEADGTSERPVPQADLE